MERKGRYEKESEQRIKKTRKLPKKKSKLACNIKIKIHKTETIWRNFQFKNYRRKEIGEKQKKMIV